MERSTLLITKLANGLKVFLKEIHNAPVVSGWNWYQVGSRDEIPGVTGASHLLEHMVGTRLRIKGKPIFPTIDRLGGVYNAATSFDFTTYYATVPAGMFKPVLEILSSQNQVQGINPDEFGLERTVVLSERQWHDNDPFFLLRETILAAAFRVHSYHHEVIGDLIDLQTMTHEDLYKYYCNYYAPNNAVLAIAGDFNTETMLEDIKELYESIPSNLGLQHRVRPEPPQSGEHHLIVEGPGETTYVNAAYHAPAAREADFFPYLVTDSLLTGPSSLNLFSGGQLNKTSRLYQALVEKELAVSFSGGLTATIDPFLHNVAVMVHPQATAEQVVAALDDEIKRLQDTPPPEAELMRAVKQARALFAYGSESITNQAFWMGYSEMFDTYDWFLNYLERLAEVRPGDVQRIAQEYLKTSNRILGVYLPNGPIGDNPGEASE